MAKKQTIILTHGSSIPSSGTTGVISSMVLGEVLVQHGTGATDTMLHTIYQTGNTEDVLVSFPSTKWVQEKIDSLESGAMAESIERIEKEYKEAVSALTATIEANELVTTKALAANHEDIVAISGSVESVISDVSAISGTVEGHEGILEQLSTNKLDKIEFEEAKASIEDTLTGLTSVLSGYTEQGEVKSEIDQLKSVKLDATAFTEFSAEYEEHVAEYEAKIKEYDQLLYGSGATEAIETLQDVLDWLDGTKEGTSGATAVIQDVNDLKDKLSDLPSGNTVVEYVTDITSELDGRIETVETEHINVVTILDTDNNKIECKRVEGTNEITIDFSKMIIDGGEY